MKKIQYISLISMVLLFARCSFDTFEDQITDVELLPTFVRFDPNVSDGDTIQLVENGATVVELENPTNFQGGVTVNFTFSGSAIFGTDFMIEGENGTALAGITAGGGSILVPDEPDSLGSFNDVQFNIIGLNDGVVDGAKTLIITLTSATAEDGSPAGAGQGPNFNTVLINFADNDFPINLPGNYNFAVDAGSDFGAGNTGSVTITEDAGGTSFTISDIGFGIFTGAVPYTLELTGPSISSPTTDPVIVETSSSVAADGVITLNVILNCCGVEGSVYTTVLTPQ